MEPPLLTPAQTVRPPFRLTGANATMITAQVLLMQVGFGVVLGVLGAIANGIRHLPPGTPVGGPLLTACGSLAAFGYVLRRQIRLRRTSWRASGTWRVAPAHLLVSVLLLALGATIFLSEVENFTHAVFPMPEKLRQLFEDLNDIGAHPFASAFAVVVVAPLTEELLFRGLLLRGLLAHTTPLRAIAISAVLFAALHLNPWQVPTALVAGILTGWIYLRTRSLTLCIFAHALNNTLVLVATGLPFVIAGYNQPHGPDVTLHQPWWFNLLGLLLAVSGAWQFRRLAAAPPPAPDEPPPPPLADCPPAPTGA